MSTILPDDPDPDDYRDPAPETQSSEAGDTLGESRSMDMTLNLSTSSCSSEARDLAAEALDVISEELSKNPSEEELFEAVERHVTDNDEANEVILEAARQMLVLMRGKAS